jgi:hypothetical protein
MTVIHPLIHPRRSVRHTIENSPKACHHVKFYSEQKYSYFVQMLLSILISILVVSAAAFPSFQPNFHENIGRTLDAIKRDPELVDLIQSLYSQQKRDASYFFANITNHTSSRSLSDRLEYDARKTTSTTCLSHPLPDFYPSDVAGLKRFPEPDYPYQDPLPSDQRGPCPGLNAMANHGYIPRTGIATLAQTIKGAAALFNMGADLTTFLAGGSVLFAGDIPTLTYSIGGADKRTNSLGQLGGALGTETGLSGHLRYIRF